MNNRLLVERRIVGFRGLFTLAFATGSRREKDARVYVMQQRWTEYRDMVKPLYYYARLLGAPSKTWQICPAVISTGVPWLALDHIPRDSERYSILPGRIDDWLLKSMEL